MGRNIEIKARAGDFQRQLGLALALSDSEPEVIYQEDTFFVTPEGRLKVRMLGPNRGELIYYRRADGEGPKGSDYSIAPTDDPKSLVDVLAAALGVRGVVRKTRTLLVTGQTRIHLDEVEGLGRFIELEVVLGSGQSDSEGIAVAGELMDRLGIGPRDLVPGAYVDLLERSK